MDLNTIVSWITTRQGLGLLGLLAVGAYLIWNNWTKVKEYIPGFRTGVDEEFDDEDYVPTRREVMDYLDMSFAYFESIGCDEGKAAIKLAAQHAFDEHLHKTEVEPDAVTAIVNGLRDALVKPPTVQTPASNLTESPPANANV